MLEYYVLLSQSSMQGEMNTVVEKKIQKMVTAIKMYFKKNTFGTLSFKEMYTKLQSVSKRNIRYTIRSSETACRIKTKQIVIFNKIPLI